MTSGLKFNHGFNGMKNYAKIPSEQSFMPGSFGPPSGLPIKPLRGSQYGLPIKPPRGYSGHLESLFNKHFSYKKNKNLIVGIDENQQPLQSEEQPTDWDLMEDSIEVFKIYKLLQRMKNK